MDNDLSAAPSISLYGKPPDIRPFSQQDLDPAVLSIDPDSKTLLDLGVTPEVLLRAMRCYFEDSSNENPRQLPGAIIAKMADLLHLNVTSRADVRKSIMSTYESLVRPRIPNAQFFEASECKLLGIGSYWGHGICDELNTLYAAVDELMNKDASDPGVLPIEPLQTVFKKLLLTRDIESLTAEEDQIVTALCRLKSRQGPLVDREHFEKQVAPFYETVQYLVELLARQFTSGSFTDDTEQKRQELDRFCQMTIRDLKQLASLLNPIASLRALQANIEAMLKCVVERTRGLSDLARSHFLALLQQERPIWLGGHDCGCQNVPRAVRNDQEKPVSAAVQQLLADIHDLQGAPDPALIKSEGAGSADQN